MQGLGLFGFLRQCEPFLEATDKGGGGGGGASDLPADDSDIDSNDALDDGAKAVMKKERKARRDADAAAKAAATAKEAADTELAALRKDKADREEAERKAREKADEDAGEFKKLAETREQERDKYKADLEAVTAERDALKTAANAIVKADFDSLPEKVRAFYPGAADDPVAMLAFIPKAKELVGELGNGDGNQDTKNVEGNKPNPKPAGEGKPDANADEAARAANAARYAY